MKANWEDDYEMPAEIDFSKLKRIPNPFQQKFEDLNLVALDDDVANVFRDSKSVNDALRVLIRAGKEAKEKIEPAEGELKARLSCFGSGKSLYVSSSALGFSWRADPGLRPGLV